MQGGTVHRRAKWLLIAALAAFLLSRTASCVVDLDLWHELALAREIVQTGAVPWEDHFAFTPNVYPVVHHEWGAGMIAYGAMLLAGSAGILVLKFALIAGVAIVCWCNARGRGASVLSTGIVLALAIVLSDYSFATVRAQMYSYLLAALLLWGFDRDRQGDRRWLLGLFALFPLWVNLHGGCLVGAAFVGAHWLEQLLRRQPHWHIFGAGAALVPLALLNPWGHHYLTYLARAITMPRPAIAEWASLWEAGQSHHLLAFLVSVGLAWLVLRDGRWRRTPGILLLAATALAALKSHRFLAFYAIAYASDLPAALSRCSLGRDLSRWWWSYQKALAILFAIATVVLLVRAGSLEPWRLRVPGTQIEGLSAHVVFPVGAVEYLREREFRGNVITPYDWGSYVMWKLGPDVQVSLDSRYEVAYPAGLMEFHQQLIEARGDWRWLLEKYPADAVLAAKDVPLATALEKHPGWRLYFRDAECSVFGRDTLGWPVLITEGKHRFGTFP
jgi:hypothetical protein